MNLLLAVITLAALASAALILVVIWKFTQSPRWNLHFLFVGSMLSLAIMKELFDLAFHFQMPLIRTVDHQWVEVAGQTVLVGWVLFCLWLVFRRDRLQEQMRHTQRKLEDKNRLIEDVMSTVHEVFWITDPELNDVQYVNSKVEEILGLREQTFRGDFSTFWKRVHEDDRQRLRQQLSNVPRGERVEAEFRVVRNGQDVRWIHGVAIPVSDNTDQVVRVIGSFREVTERKQYEQELQTTQRRFQEIADTVNDALFLISPDYERVLFMNTAHEEIFEIPNERLEKEPLAWLERIHPEDRDAIKKNVLKQKGMAERQEHEYRLVRSDGSERWVRAQIHPIRNGSGPVRRLAGVVTDITDLKTVQRELETALEQKDHLMKEMHHRVKNNLQVVSSLLGLQKRQMEHESCREILEQCQKRVRNIAQVHKQLHQNDDVSRVNVQTFFSNLISEIQNLYDLAEDVEVRTELESVVLEYDRTIVCCLVLYELLANAIEHGISDQEQGLISVKFEGRDDRWRLRVEDNGKGLPEGFDIAESESLGLRLSRNLVEQQLKGELTAQQTESGTRFEVVFDRT